MVTSRKHKKTYKLMVTVIVILLSVVGFFNNNIHGQYTSNSVPDIETSFENGFKLSDVPEYTKYPAVSFNNNHPEFTDEEYMKAESKYIELSELDFLGRCGKCEGSLGSDTLCDAERESISSIHPTGWEQAFYPELISKNEGALYNRCHLIMYAISGIMKDERDLITGTEYMNTKGMLSYETSIQKYIERYPEERILYRVTPIFIGNELVARGVHMEAASVSNQGESFHINVYCYNVEPGVNIDYMTGKSTIS